MHLDAGKEYSSDHQRTSRNAHVLMFLLPDMLTARDDVTVCLRNGKSAVP